MRLVKSGGDGGGWPRRRAEGEVARCRKTCLEVGTGQEETEAPEADTDMAMTMTRVVMIVQWIDVAITGQPASGSPTRKWLDRIGCAEAKVSSTAVAVVWIRPGLVGGEMGRYAARAPACVVPPA